MFSSIFDSDASELQSWSNFSWETGRSTHSRSTTLQYVIDHVFLPVHHPHKGDYTEENAHALACAVHAAACAYNEYIDDVHKPHWLCITKMLENLHSIIKATQLWTRHDSPDPVIMQLGEMKAGDMLVFPVPNHHGIIFRKQGQRTLYELLCPSESELPEERGDLINSYPWLAIEIPNEVFDNGNFRSRLADLRLDRLGWSMDLLTAMLRGVGHPVEPNSITKCTGPNHSFKSIDGSIVWFRSHLWFLIRVAIQSSLKHPPFGHVVYKDFMLFFMCNLANYAVNTGLSSLLLHSMSAKILRRFRKLGSSIPQWLCDAVLHTCTGLSCTLDQRWQEVQATQSLSLHWSPIQLNLTKDIHSSFPHVHEYISVSLANNDINPPGPHTPLFPNSRLRGTLIDFLYCPGWSSIIHLDDIHTMLYDVERAVEEDLDDWVACVTNVDEACEQLEHLIYQCQLFALHTYDPDHLSIMFLTIIELWVALDKLVVKEIPMLAEYSPEIPVHLLYQLLLHDVAGIHRLRRAYEYLFARHAQAHPGWSVFSNEFTKHSFPARYYDSSPQLQHLKVRIMDSLPPEPLQAKVVVFELRCPVFFDTWRSITCWISHDKVKRTPNGKDIPIHHIPALKPHIRAGRDRLVYLYSSPSAPQCWNGSYYVYVGSSLGRFKHTYKLPSGPYADSGLQQYLDNTIHTSNEVLAAQAGCNPNLSLHEFVAFAHLRSGGSLQWFNILRELRSRTLDFRHHEVYLLLAQASAQVGPFDGTTGELLWHQELQDASFCHTLLGELEVLFIDVGVGPSDGRAMAVISLLAGVLASKAFEDISERAIKLLRKVRQKTFDWVHELLYNVRKSPMNEESRKLLRDMAAICRSTFDVDSATSRKLLRSSHDIEAALSCAMLIQTIGLPTVSDVPTDSHVLLDRDRRLSLVLEGSLRAAIEADITDLGIDRSVQLIWPGYRPSLSRWKPLQSPNSRWLVSRTTATMDRRSQTVHINLLDGSLLVDSKPVNKLPNDVTRDSGYRELFGDHDLMVVASDLPGMDYVTISATHKHNVHFAIRNDNDTSRFWKRGRVVLRAQSEDTDDIFELIPREILQEDLPKSLVEGHFHWLNLYTSVIEVRPVEKPWDRSSANWTIHFQPGQSRVKKGGELLVDQRSQTWEMVTSHFRSIDDPGHLIVTVSPDDTTRLRVSVTLPRYGLSFFVNEVGNLESRDFKDMVYDEDQSIGTLFGLSNLLVLRPKAQLEVDLTPKCILVPHSDHLYQHDHYIHVDLPSSGPVRHYTYQVDSELGCLKGIVSLESRLYLARLHTLTSSECRPDPLTGRTGVEEAVSLIWLAGTQQEIDGSCAKLQSFQIRFALEKLQGHAYPPGDWDGLLRESYLFPSEVSASLQLPGKGPFESLDQLLCERPPPNLQARDRLPRHNPGCHSPTNTHSLRQLFSSFRKNETAPPFQSQYISRLHSSAHHFQTTVPNAVTCQGGSRRPDTDALRKHYVRCRINYTESFDMIKMVLEPKTEFQRILDQCGQWPRITPFILFRCLASTSPVELPENWKKCLTALALLALDLQRARRLLRFALDNLEEELYNELETEGCDGWDAAKHLDWLLIQLQGNFLVRRVQADVAKETLSRSGKNTVMQVNMGKGKTSVIIPICAAALADGNQLVRVIVPKELIPQTLQVLTDRLCGLVNKPVYHLTFSRDDTNVAGAVDKVKRLHRLVLKCRDECGIIVMQPEHVVSLKLACVEAQLPEKRIGTNSTPNIQKWALDHALHVLTGSLLKSLTENTYVSAMIGRINRWHREPEISGVSIKSRLAATARPDQAEGLLKLQRFLQTHARDILDESDDVLRPQFQLIYAIGHQHPFEGSPDRWVIVQQVLGLVKRHAYFLSSPDSHTIWCDGSSLGSFPQIHILQAEAGERLVSLIADDISDGRLPSLGFHSKLGLRGAIREFILRKDIHPDTVKMVEEYARQSTSWGSLLLMRGILANDVLLFALTQRRWRVDYGLDPTTIPRTMLAIPYRAKDVPAEKAEFGHPDITILLTCLSYYYEGLSEEQLIISFELLLQQDDPSSEYALWLEDCATASVPNPLRTLSNVNIRSLEQWINHLVPLFTRNKRAIDLYLSKVVFPNHAKEFPVRISGSSWDIAERKNHRVTGFSGTNDGQYLLPTSIAQEGPDYLRQTGANAMVLAYLLQPENSSYMVTAGENGKRWTTLELLGMVVAQNPQIRVLLDVGAQILDLSNLQLAKAWLDCTPGTDTAGAIYFSEDDQLMVLARNGTTQPLSMSPLAQRLDKCVAYLDDAHTRGTDLKFPRGFRAAVILGHKVTKDRLVQGCMRMRKLGHGHSVMFFAPQEVDQRIRGLITKENPNIPVTTANILHWAIHETWSDIQRQAPYWAQKGISHQSRYEAWSRFCRSAASPEQLADAWVQPELKSLADMYMPCHSLPTTSSMKLPRQIRDRCATLGVLSLPDVRMDEEQEREVSREIEREREVERRPLTASPATHSLHPDVIQFVRTGIVPSPSWSVAFRHVFATGFTAASSGSHAWSPYILATADFCETIREITTIQGRENDYLRPVHWVLSGTMHGKDALVLLSPFEADRLMPEIRISKHVRLHLYTPRTTKRMKPSDDLRLYSVPPLPSDWVPPWTLIDQLNVFAGQLYLRDYTSYVRLSRFLGIHTEDLPQRADTVVARNWFSNPDSSDEEIRNRLEGTPLPLVMQLLAIRRGMGFARTHMGRILEGWPLTEEDFQSPPDHGTSMTIGHFEQEQLSISAELASIEQELRTTRKRVLDSESVGHLSKRKRSN